MAGLQPSSLNASGLIVDGRSSTHTSDEFDENRTSGIDCQILCSDARIYWQRRAVTWNER